MLTHALARWASSATWGVRAAALLLLALVSCSASFDGRIYHGDGFSFSVAQPPAEWQPISVTSAALAYEERDFDGQVLVNARCDRDGDDASLRSLTQHLFLRFTQREAVSEEVFPFDGREALRSEVTAKLDGVSRSFLVWVLKKDRCVYDLLYVAPPEQYSLGAPRFDAWARQFSALPRSVSP
jgi:hypothetical protein